MGNKWNITEKTGVYNKCCQMEKMIQSIFQSPNAWANGFIRLVSLEGTWYYHRETGIFIPIMQNYLKELYLANAKPERGSIHVKSKDIDWDYMDEQEALQILPGLLELNLLRTAGGSNLNEEYRNKIIFLKDHKVYDGINKKVRLLQDNEKGIVLQICHLEDRYKRNNYALWNYDIYLWAKAGVIPSALCSVKECWNTMQFLIDNFNNIDFTDFILPGEVGKAATEEPKTVVKSNFVEKEKSVIKDKVSVKTESVKKPEGSIKEESFTKSEVPVKKEPPKNPENSIKQEPVVKSEVSVKAEPITKQESSEKTEAPVKPESSVKPDSIIKPEASEKTEAPAKPESSVKPEPIAKPEVSEKAEIPTKPENFVKPDVSEKPDVLVKSESSVKPESIAEPEVSEKAEVLTKPESLLKPEVSEKTESIEKLKSPVKPEALTKPEVSQKAESIEKPKSPVKPEALTKPEVSQKAESIEKLKSPIKPEALTKPEVSQKAESIEKPKSPVKPEALTKPKVSEKTESMEKSKNPLKPEALTKPEVSEKTESMEKPKNPIKPESLTKPDIFVKKESWSEAKIPGKEEFLIKPELSAKSDSTKKSEVFVKEEPLMKPEIKAEPIVKPEVSVKKEPSVKSDISVKTEVATKPVVSVKENGSIKPDVSVRANSAIKPNFTKKTESPLKPEIAEKPNSVKKVEYLLKPEHPLKPEIMDKSDFTEKMESPLQSEIKIRTEIPVKTEVAVAPEYPEKQKNFGTEMVPQKQENHKPQEQIKRFRGAEKMDIVQREEEIIENVDKVQKLLDCDKDRCRLEPYDKDILYDIIRGHWELFDEKEEAKESNPVEKNNCQNLIARNPKLDIKQGVIGIDFGTKSTVVVRQDTTNRIIPIRIGTGNLSNEVKEEDFENPSIIEFTNVKKFLGDYQKDAGRPHTSCNDIFVSYDAYEDFRNCKPDDFYAYFNELKQWANREKGNVVIKDKQREEYYLGENMDAIDRIVNPIELYAYYIGLYINNMRNGIYLKYLMSFPVGYAKEIRDFIAKSFYEGIKKSLPSSILNDKECMEQFKVELGISEPAAYAVTALEQCHLEPKDETERLMYGIFDFGGGTTDFDFGICRGATEEEYEKEAYDYVLECFGADSDVTLGGENILELMAYQVYQKNLDVFREKKITFTLPLGENGFAGSETLLINSQIARRNMAILREELRPLWYQEQGWRKKYQLDNESQSDTDKEGIVVSLYNMDGEPVPQCILEFSTQDLIETLKNRIQKGIDSFFQCLIKIFLSKEKENKEEDTIYIFLAGNSSKSIFVKELFQRKIEEYYSKSKKLSEGMVNVHFELIDPLTGENETNDRYVPNAKTGVAYGLLKSRDGSSIKIIKNYETDSLQQSRFRYYLGRDHRHYFDCKFSPKEISYKKWVPFQAATKGVIRIYYTNNPMADSKMEQMPIENVPYKEIDISVREDAYLFIRTIEPDMVEYVVAKEVEEISDTEIKKCYFN